MDTDAWYTANARAFIEATAHLDMSTLHGPFLSLLPPGAAILDVGCGSGRDSLAFLQQGFRVVPLEPCEALAAQAETLLRQPVGRQRVQELEETEAFDGIWACASLLHVPASETTEVLARLARALKPGGVLYTSYKLGQGEREAERFFHDQNEDSLRALLEGASLTVLNLWLTDDARGDHGQRWVNALAGRASTSPPGLPQGAIAHVACLPRGALSPLRAALGPPGCLRQRARISVGFSPFAAQWAPARHRQDQAGRSTMIRNESEYQEAVRRHREELTRLAQHQAQLQEMGLTDEQQKRALDPLRSFHLQLQEEITHDERLKRGDLDAVENLHGLGRMLIALRIALGLTQRQLAERLGVHESQVSRDERNEYHGVTVERASRLLDALGVNLLSHFTRPVVPSPDLLPDP
jgi:protein-L-isoaspartate O-methyltransferase/DNA-binding transcriptional regulator YiaG